MKLTEIRDWHLNWVKQNEMTLKLANNERMKALAESLQKEIARHNEIVASLNLEIERTNAIKTVGFVQPLVIRAIAQGINVELTVHKEEQAGLVPIYADRRRVGE